MDTTSTGKGEDAVDIACCCRSWWLAVANAVLPDLDPPSMEEMESTAAGGAVACDELDGDLNQCIVLIILPGSDLEMNVLRQCMKMMEHHNRCSGSAPNSGAPAV
ncbi:hypothetical protein ACLOJK_010305 [Asimina triloba]